MGSKPAIIDLVNNHHDRVVTLKLLYDEEPMSLWRYSKLGSFVDVDENANDIEFAWNAETQRQIVSIYLFYCELFKI